MIAHGWTDLADGSLERTIQHDEHQYEWTNCSIFTGLGRIWTGTGADGSAASPFCGDWTRGDGTQEMGQVGYYCDKGGAWTAEAAWSCAVERSLYCFQQ